MVRTPWVIEKFTLRLSRKTASNGILLGLFLIYVVPAAITHPSYRVARISLVGLDWPGKT